MIDRPSILTRHKISRYLLQNRLLDMGYISSFDAGKNGIQFPACPDNPEWVKFIFMSPFNNWGPFSHQGDKGATFIPRCLGTLGTFYIAIRIKYC
jgi:hypothetical protein